MYNSVDYGALVVKCATKTSTAIYALIQKDGSPSIILSKLNHTPTELNSYSTKNGVSNTWADNQARISNAVGPPTSTALAVCVHGLTGKVQFTLYISDDGDNTVTRNKNYLTSTWAQCLGVRAINGSNADYVLLDVTKNLWWYSINFDSPRLWRDSPQHPLQQNCKAINEPMQCLAKVLLYFPEQYPKCQGFLKITNWDL